MDDHGRDTPLRPVRMVRYNTVQEQASDAWSSTSPGAQVRVAFGSFSPMPTGTFDFTEWSVPGLTPAHVQLQSYDPSVFAFRNCQFAGGKVGASGPVDFKNCLLQRVDGFVADYPSARVNCWSNNTFLGGTFSFYNNGGGLWRVFNNAFYDTADLGSASGLLHGWNAYLPGAAMVAAR